MKTRLRRTVLAVLAACPSAFAEQAVQHGERIEVTGSRLASSDAESASPIAVIRAEDIRLEGFQSIELVLNNFPQFTADQGTRISAGATGTATANLRALGAERTLVLMNGKRMPAGSPFNLAPDLNQVPMALIQRVEILTGGASAVYGSDAIAGVVNFILNDHFEGVQGDIAYDFYNHKQKNGWVQGLLAERGIPIPGDKSMDGESGSASLTLGGNFAQDKGNAAVSFRYFKSKALLQSERDYSACALFRDDANRVVCGGSPTTDRGAVQDLPFFPPDPAVEPLDHFPRLAIRDRATGRVRDFAPADVYNYAPYNYYQRPQERYGFNAFANYEIAPSARIYAEFGYHDDQTIAQVAPSGIFFQNVAVRYENPLLDADWRSRLTFRNADGTIGTGPGTTAFVAVSQRNVLGGGRQDDLRHTSVREIVGIKGQVADHWDYDVFFQDSRVHYEESYKHDFSRSRIIRALDVVPDPATGAPVCASALSGTDRNCVPYNLWALNGVTPAATAYLEVPALERALTTQQVIGGTVSANLGDYGIRMPRTHAGVEVAFGIERRTEKLDFEADQQFADLAGSDPIASVKGGFTVKEVFGEIRVPLFDRVNLSGSYRHSDYDTGFATNTYGVGFNAAPVKFVGLRGSVQKAVRAPNANELFSPQFPGGYDIVGGDPCAGPTPARSLAECQRTGVTPALYGHIIQVPEDQGFPSTTGGNAALQSEAAKTYTLGFVFTPGRDFSATIDYFDIRVDDTISAIGGRTIVEQCLASGDPFFCRLVTRDPSSQALWYGGANVVAINQNIGKTRVAGTDFAVNYRLRLSQGHSIAFDGLGTYLHKQSVEEYPQAPSVDCAGLFMSACTGVPLPKWRHRLRATWKPPANFEAAATWRYIHSTNAAPDFQVRNDIPLQVAQQPAVSYFDLAGSWDISKRVTVRGGVNNIADRDPPLIFAGGYQFNGNAFAQVYDALGRHVFVSATVKF